MRVANFRASAYHECNEDSALLWNHGLQATFFARIASFASWFHPRGYFFAIICHTEYPHTWAADEATAALNSCHSTSASTVRSGISRKEDDRLSPKVFRTAFSPDPPAFLVVLRFAPCWFSKTKSLKYLCVDRVGFLRHKLQITRWWPVDSSSPLLTWTSNNDWNKSAETLQKSMSDRWPNKSLHQVYVIFVVW